MCLIWMLTLYSKFLTLYLCLEQWKLLLWRRVFFLPNFFILILLFFFVFRCISQLVFFFFCWIFLTSCYLFRGILIACHLAEEQVNERKWIPPYTFLFFCLRKVSTKYPLSYPIYWQNVNNACFLGFLSSGIIVRIYPEIESKHFSKHIPLQCAASLWWLILTIGLVLWTSR